MTWPGGIPLLASVVVLTLQAWGLLGERMGALAVGGAALVMAALVSSQMQPVRRAMAA